MRLGKQRASLAALGVAMALIVGTSCTTGNDDSTPATTATVGSSSPTVTSTEAPSAATETTTPSSTSTATPTAVLSQWPEAPGDLPAITLEQRTDPPGAADRTLSPVEPESPFPDPGSLEEVLLYDFETGEVESLGPSSLGGGRFSADGRYFVWPTAEGTGGTLHVRDMESGDVHEIGSGGIVSVFVEDYLLYAMNSPRADSDWLVDVSTGERERLPIEDRLVRASDGLFLTAEAGEDGRPHRFTVWRGFGRAALVQVAAEDVSIVDESTVVAIMSPVDGIASIYLIDVETQDVTFVATSQRGFGGGIHGDGRYVAWVEDACAYDEAAQEYLYRARIWDAADGSITEIDRSWFIADIDAGRLAIGAFGPQAWLDLETGDWLAAVPTSGEMAGWSPDLRYASVGRLLGHGGRCGS